MSLNFRALYPWALLPRKVKVDLRAKQREVAMFAENFRWLRMERSAELCYPWRLGEEMGWVVDSPITVTMDALHDVEVSGEASEIADLHNITQATEYHWFRDAADKPPKFLIFTRNSGWLRLFVYHTPEGDVQMFKPNGQGSVEWGLGFEVTIPPKHFLLLMPYRHYPNLEVITGVLDPAANERMNARKSFAIGVRPVGPITVTRGQPIARLVLLRAESVVESASETPDSSTHP